MPFSEPSAVYPVTLPDGRTHEGTVFLKPAIDHPRITVGDYTYMSCHAPLLDSAEIAARLAPYLFEFSPERLEIGAFCQIAHGVQFITSSANHRYDGLSTYPFAIFDDVEKRPSAPSMPEAGPDTIVGNDVWLGTGAMVLPGVRIGDGAIVGAGTVVASDVSPYTIVAGNPAREIRPRLSREDAERMQRVAWWSWPMAAIRAHEAIICGSDLDALETAALEIATLDR